MRRVLLAIATAASLASTAAFAQDAAKPAAPAQVTTPMDISKFNPVDVSTLKGDQLKGVEVLDVSGNKIATIDDIVLTQNGKIDAVIIDFGGFLGIGKKEVAVAFDGLKFLSDANKTYLQINATKEQLDAQKAYNKDDYATNRDAERLVIKP